MKRFSVDLVRSFRPNLFRDKLLNAVNIMTRHCIKKFNRLSIRYCLNHLCSLRECLISLFWWMMAIDFFMTHLCHYEMFFHKTIFCQKWNILKWHELENLNISYESDSKLIVFLKFKYWQNWSHNFNKFRCTEF